MKAYSANATFISNIYTQEVGDTNWNEYQVVVTGGSNSLNVRSADTTSNNLSVLNETRISSNDTILLSTDGSNVVSGVCGLVTNGTIKTQTSTPAIVTARSIAANTSPFFSLYTSAITTIRGYKLKPDGKVFWITRGDGTLVEYSVGTVGNLTTATTTGKTVANCQGIDFSPDGKYLFRMSNTVALTIERLTLTTPWDISTATATVSKAVASLPNGAAFYGLRMQADGLGFVVGYHGGAGWYRCTMTTAWDVSTAAYSYAVTIPNSGVAYDVTSDGKTWYWSTYSAASTVLVYAAVAGTAWDPRTLGTSVILTCTDATYVSHTSSYFMSPLVHLDGSLTLLPAQLNTGTVYNRIATFNVDIALSKNIDISAFGLSSPPTNAWLKMPTTSVSTSKTPTPNWTSKELELDGNVNGYTSGIAATTTSAVVGIDGTSVLSTGDSVILNGTTTVTLTGVTETSNGLVKLDIGNAVDYIKFANKTFETGTATSDTTYSNTNAQQHTRFSSDGVYFYVFGGNTSSQGIAVYQYSMSTPWDVSTASLKSVFKPSSSLSLYNSSYTLPSGFDINPNGTSFVIVWGTSNAGTKIYQYFMTTAHNMDTITTSPTIKDGVAYIQGNSGMVIARARFNRTGTQLLFQESYNGSLWTWYQTLGTAYDISSLNTTITLTSGSAYTNDECFSPDGTLLIGLGTGWNDGYMFSVVPGVTNSWAAPIPTSISTASNTTYVNWPAGSVTTSTHIRSLDISTDGTKLYAVTNNGTVYQFNVRLKTINKYALTFAAQGSAPTSVSIPASVTTPTMTTSVVSGNIVQTSNNITTNARSIQFKLTNNPAYSEITKVQLNLRKSA